MQQRADAKLNQQMRNIASQRSAALQSAAINNDKLMKYLPAQLKAMGMSNLGVSQSSYIRAANDYASQRSAINQQFNNAESEAWNAYADAQAQRDIANNQAIMEAERYYREKEDLNAKEADDTFIKNIQSIEWNSPEELEAYITSEEQKGNASEDAIAWARILQADFTGDFNTANEEKGKERNLGMLNNEIQTAIESGLSKEEILAIAKEYESKVDSDMYDSILRQIDSYGIGKERADGVKNDTDFKDEINADIWNTPEELEAFINAAEADGKVSADAIAWARRRLDDFTGDFTKAEDDRIKAEEDNAKTELANSLLGRVMGGIKAGYSREQLEGILTGHSAADVGDLAWAEMQELINQAAFMSEEEKAARATEIANENVDFYISNGLYEDDTPEEFFLWMEQNAADADDEVWNRGMDMYRQNAKDQLKAEAERIKAEEDAAAAKAMTTADSMINEIIQTFDGKPDDLDATLEKYMDSASELGREYAEYFRNMYRIGYEEAKEEQSKTETDEMVLEGRIPVEYNARKWRITGDAITPADAHDDDFVEALEDILIVTPTPGATSPGAASYSRGQIKTPYDEKLRNGMTVTVRKKTYTFYNGEWYPSEKSK